MPDGPRSAGRLARQLANLGLGQSRFHQRRRTSCSLRGVLARTVIAQVVLVDAVDDVRDASRRADFFQPREQLVLAVEAAVGIIGDVVRIFELVCLDVLVANIRFAGELLGIALVRLRNRGRIGGDRDRLSPSTRSAAQAR